MKTPHHLSLMPNEMARVKLVLLCIHIFHYIFRFSLLNL